MDENRKIVFTEAEVNILSYCIDERCEEMLDTDDPRLAVLLPIRDKLHKLKNVMQKSSEKNISISLK